MNGLAIFVNTCDAFEDCWEPFFKLFKEYGGALRNCTIYLNTEHKKFDYEGLNIVCLKVNGARNHRLSWSECLDIGLSKVKEPYVLYLQEDYFFNQDVALPEVKTALDFLKAKAGNAVYLNEFGPIINSPIDTDFIVPVPVSSKYLLSTQACIWKVSYLKGLLLPWENGWMFEKFGCLRLKNDKGNGIFTVSPISLEERSTVSYIYTGVMKGAWHLDCVELFAAHRLDINFDRRGFYKSRNRWQSKFEVLRMLFSNPKHAFMSVVRSL